MFSHVTRWVRPDYVKKFRKKCRVSIFDPLYPENWYRNFSENKGISLYFGQFSALNGPKNADTALFPKIFLTHYGITHRL